MTLLAKLRGRVFNLRAGIATFLPGRQEPSAQVSWPVTVLAVLASVIVASLALRFIWVALWGDIASAPTLWEVVVALFGAPFMVWGLMIQNTKVITERERHVAEVYAWAAEQLGSFRETTTRDPSSAGMLSAHAEITEPNREARLGAILGLKRLALRKPGESKDVLRILVARFSQIEGYRCLSLMRALGVVKCQLAFV
jgi:hypothetical protein